MTDLPLVVLVTGDRRWSSAKAVGAVLRRLPQPFVLIQGEARGADRIAAAVAGGMMMRVEGFPALWDAEGRAAGPLRNRRMLDRLKHYRDLGHECRVIAFHNDLSQSKGTANMVKIARRAGFRVTVVSHKQR